MESKCEEVSGIESLRHEFQAFKSFFVEQVHLIKHRKLFESYGNDDNDTRYINTLINQINFLKEENQTKNIMIQSLLDRCSINFDNNDKMKCENNEFDNNKCNSKEKSNPNNVNHKYSLYDKNRDNNCRCNDNISFKHNSSFNDTDKSVIDNDNHSSNHHNNEDNSDHNSGDKTDNNNVTNIGNKECDYITSNNNTKYVTTGRRRKRKKEED